jgi:hypothetical protein
MCMYPMLDRLLLKFLREKTTLKCYRKLAAVRPQRCVFCCRSIFQNRRRCVWWNGSSQTRNTESGEEIRRHRHRHTHGVEPALLLPSFLPGGVPLSSLVTYYRCSNLLVTHIKQILKAEKKCGVCQFKAFKNFKIIKTYYSFQKSHTKKFISKMLTVEN